MDRAAIARRFRCQRYRKARLTRCKIPNGRPVVEHDDVRHQVVVRPDNRVADGRVQRIRHERSTPECSDDVDRQLNRRRNAISRRRNRPWVGRLRCSRIWRGNCSRVRRRWRRIVAVVITIAVVVDISRSDRPTCPSHVFGRARRQRRWREGRCSPLFTATGKDAGKRGNDGKSARCIESHIASARQSQYHAKSARMAGNSGSSNRLDYETRNRLRALLTVVSTQRRSSHREDATTQRRVFLRD